MIFLYFLAIISVIIPSLILIYKFKNDIKKGKIEELYLFFDFIKENVPDKNKRVFINEYLNERSKEIRSKKWYLY